MVYFWVYFLVYFLVYFSAPGKEGMEKTYYHKQGNRHRFWMKTPKQLWDWLPKIIVRDLKQPDTADIRSRCLACGERLRNLFGRAVKGMVDRTVLRALVDEICNEELYQDTTPAEIVDVRQPIPTQPDLLQGFLAQILRSLNINLNFTTPPQPQEPVQTVPAVSLPYRKPASLYLIYFNAEMKIFKTFPAPADEKRRRSCENGAGEGQRDFRWSRFQETGKFLLQG